MDDNFLIMKENKIIKSDLKLNDLSTNEDLNSVSDTVIGVNQSWKTVSMEMNTTYYNRTKRPIYLVIKIKGVMGGILDVNLKINNLVSFILKMPSNGTTEYPYGTISSMIFPGDSYVISNYNNRGSIDGAWLYG